MKTPEQILMAMGGFLVTRPYLKAPQRYEITAKLQQILQEMLPETSAPFGNEPPDIDANVCDCAAVLDTVAERR